MSKTKSEIEIKISQLEKKLDNYTLSDTLANADYKAIEDINSQISNLEKQLEEAEDGE